MNNIKVGDKFRSKHVKNIELEVLSCKENVLEMKYISHPRQDRVGCVVSTKINELEQWEKINNG